MGLIWSQLTGLSNLWSQKPHKILLLGLDNAGKTTLLYWTRLQTAIVTIPTIGINVEEVKLKKSGITFLTWDVGGQEQLREFWSRFYEDAAGLIFMVDSADVARLGVARSELHRVMTDPVLKGVPFVVLANKQDVSGAVSVEEVGKYLELSTLGENGHDWLIQPTVANVGKGVLEVLEKFAQNVKRFAKQKRRK